MTNTHLLITFLLISASATGSGNYVGYKCKSDTNDCALKKFDQVDDAYSLCEFTGIIQKLISALFPAYNGVSYLFYDVWIILIFQIVTFNAISTICIGRNQNVPGVSNRHSLIHTYHHYHQVHHSEWVGDWWMLRLTKHSIIGNKKILHSVG